MALGAGGVCNDAGFLRSFSDGWVAVTDLEAHNPIQTHCASRRCQEHDDAFKFPMAPPALGDEDGGL